MKCLLVFLFLTLFAGMVSAQQTETDSLRVSHDSLSHNLSLKAEVDYYILPSEKYTATLIGNADYKASHFEVRYNYEALHTFSVFGGYKFSAGQRFKAAFTPILGFEAGNINGIIPG